MMTLPRKLAGLLFVTFLILTAPVWAQSPGPASEAESALRQGLGAAQRQEWDAAVEAFGRAHKAAPEDAPVLFNLGLAHAKAGREIMAILWFHCYLAAAPSAANAADVRLEIERLKAAVRQKMEKIYQGAEQAASRLENVYERDSVLDSIRSFKRSYGGDIATAIAGLDPASETFRQRVAHFALSLVRSGLTAEAEAALVKLAASESTDDAWLEIAEAKLDSGDAAGARAAAQRSGDAEKVARLLNLIPALELAGAAEEDYRSGREAMAAIDRLIALNHDWLLRNLDGWAGARKDFAFAETLLGKIAKGFIRDQARAWAELGRVYMILGERSRMGRARDMLKQLAARLPADQKAPGLQEIMVDLVSLGDLSGARTLAQELRGIAQVETSSDYRQVLLAAADAVAGDAQAFGRAAAVRGDSAFFPGQRDLAYAPVAFMAVVTGDFASAERIVAKLDQEHLPSKERNQRIRLGQTIPPGFNLGIAAAALAKGYLARGEVKKALDALTRSRQQGRAFSSVAREVFQMSVAQGEFGQALDALQLWWRCGCLEETRPHLRPPVSVMIDRFAALLMADSKLFERFGSELYWRARKDYLLARPGLPSLARLAARIEGSGSVGSAGSAKKDLQAWLALTARTLDYAEYDLAAIDLDAALRRATRRYFWTNEPEEPKTIPGQVAEVAVSLGQRLMEIRALERQSGYAPPVGK